MWETSQKRTGNHIKYIKIMLQEALFIDFMSMLDVSTKFLIKFNYTLIKIKLLYLLYD